MNHDIELCIKVKPTLEQGDLSDLSDLAKVLGIVAKGMGYSIETQCKRKDTRDDLTDTFFSYLVWHEIDRETVAWCIHDGDMSVDGTLGRIYRRYAESVDNPQPFEDALHLVREMTGDYLFAWMDICP